MLAQWAQCGRHRRAAPCVPWPHLDRFPRHGAARQPLKAVTRTPAGRRRPRRARRAAGQWGANRANPARSLPRRRMLPALPGPGALTVAYGRARRVWRPCLALAPASAPHRSARGGVQACTGRVRCQHCQHVVRLAPWPRTDKSSTAGPAQPGRLAGPARIAASPHRRTAAADHAVRHTCHRPSSGGPRAVCDCRCGCGHDRARSALRCTIRADRAKPGLAACGHSPCSRGGCGCGVHSPRQPHPSVGLVLDVRAAAGPRPSSRSPPPCGVFVRRRWRCGLRSAARPPLALSNPVRPHLSWVRSLRRPTVPVVIFNSLPRCCIRGHPLLPS